MKVRLAIWRIGIEYGKAVQIRQKRRKYLMNICKKFGECMQYVFGVELDRKVEEAIMIWEGTMANEVIPLRPTGEGQYLDYQSLVEFRQNSHVIWSWCDCY